MLGKFRESRCALNKNVVKFRVKITYLLSEESFSGSCCLTLWAATLGELVELTKLTGDGLIAE